MNLDKIRDNFGSFQEVWTFVEIVILITVLPLMLKLLSLSNVMKTLTPRNPKHSATPDRQHTRDRIVKYTDYILSRNLWVYKQVCIKRALVLYHFLRRAGLGVRVCFGVRYNREEPEKVGKKLEGHAWLSYDGEIFLEQDVEIAKTYKKTYCYPVEA